MKSNLIFKSLLLAPWLGVLASLVCAGSPLPPVLRALTSRTAFQETNLVSDLPGMARYTDPSLLNPWGMFVAPGVVLVADNHAGVATAYRPGGRAIPLVVTIPPPKGGTGPAAPTGLVLNQSGQFLIPAPGAQQPMLQRNDENGDGGGGDGDGHQDGDRGGDDGNRMPGSGSQPSLFIFVTEDGTISGWNPAVNPTAATLMVDNSGMEAVYKAVTIGWSEGKPYLFAANFKGGMVEVYDGQFKPVKTFTDTTLPAGYAPFGLDVIQGRLFVTFAKQKGPDNQDDEAGLGHGYVDIFSTKGDFVRRFASEGTLNSPWGLALAGSHFGRFSRALLVGNFGDGRINAFNPWTGTFLGQLQDDQGAPLEIEGLWSLAFESFGEGENNRLYFTAGPGDEEHGLLGILLPARDHHNLLLSDSHDD